MREIHEVLRLHCEHGRSKQEIAHIINVSPFTVADYVARAKLASSSSPLALECDNAPWSDGCSRPASRRRCSNRRWPGRRCTTNCAARATRWNCCGRSTKPSSRTINSTARSASTTGAGASN